MRFITAGESHGKGLMVILEGVPAGVPFDILFINQELRRRQKFFGRGDRMRIEEDEVEVISGVRGGETIGSPIALWIKNRDWENWKEVMDPLNPSPASPLTTPRPGHADLAGAMKFLSCDIRNILERASARETAARTAAGAVCKLFLRELNIEIWGWVEEIGGIKADYEGMEKREIKKKVKDSELLSPDPEAEKKWKEKIKWAMKEGDTLGGVFSLIAENVPPGLGSYTQWDLRLDGMLAQAVMSIPGIKGVEIGEGFSLSSMLGSEAMDEIVYKGKRIVRLTNRMGGIEGGISNGEDIVLKAVMKPIPTLRKPLKTIDFSSFKESVAFRERGDVVAVPSACVVGEAMVSFIIAREIKRKLGGDTLFELKRNLAGFLKEVRKRYG